MWQSTRDRVAGDLSVTPWRLPDAVLAVPAGVTVRGGFGGTRAHLEELEQVAIALGCAAERLRAAAVAVLPVDEVIEQAAEWSPATAYGARSAIAPLRSRWSGLDELASRAEETAAAVRRAAAAYRDADATGTRLLGAGAAVGGAILGEAGPAIWATGGAVLGIGAFSVVVHQTGLRGLVESAAAVGRSPVGLLTPLGLALRRPEAFAEVERQFRALGMPGALALGLMRHASGPDPAALPGQVRVPSASSVEPVVAGVAGSLLGVLPGRRPLTPDPVPSVAEEAARGLVLAGALRGDPGTRLVVAPVVLPTGLAHGQTDGRVHGQVHDRADERGDEQASRSVGGGDGPPAPRGLDDVLDQVAEGYLPVGDGGGTVGVQRLDHEDGSRSWVVTVPGTQEWSPVPGPNPADLSSNLVMMAGATGDPTEVVAQAMVQAGIAPHEPVLIAGHSQGGIAAMQVAGDARLSDRFAVEAVVTAGSPVAHLPAPPGVEVLHLENRDDYVPAIDGRANPVAANRTTVEVDRAAVVRAVGGVLEPGPLAAHDLAGYAASARMLDVVDHPSVNVATEAIAGVLGGGTARATMTRYAGVRVPADVTSASSGSPR